MLGRTPPSPSTKHCSDSGEARTRVLFHVKRCRPQRPCTSRLSPRAPPAPGGPWVLVHRIGPLAVPARASDTEAACYKPDKPGFSEAGWRDRYTVLGFWITMLVRRCLVARRTSRGTPWSRIALPPPRVPILHPNLVLLPRLRTGMRSLRWGRLLKHLPPKAAVGTEQDCMMPAPGVSVAVLPTTKHRQPPRGGFRLPLTATRRKCSDSRTYSPVKPRRFFVQVPRPTDDGSKFVDVPRFQTMGVCSFT